MTRLNPSACFPLAAILLLASLSAQSSPQIAAVDDSQATPPVTKADIQIVQLARKILDSPAKWNRADDSVCPPDARTFSLYCALEKATGQVSGNFEHRGAAMQEARFVIDEEVAKGTHYEHRLMNYNNDPATSFADIRKVFDLLETRLQKRLIEGSSKLPPSIRESQTPPQSPVQPSLSFEVVSIKPDIRRAVPSEEPGSFLACRGTDGPARSYNGSLVPSTSSIQVPLGRCVGMRASLRMLLTGAYDIPTGWDGWVSGKPDWMDSDRYALEAKAENSSTGRQLQEMLQTLLVDRFQLQFHWETKLVDGFVLAIGKNGSKFKAATGLEENPGFRISGSTDPLTRQPLETRFFENVPFSEFVRDVGLILANSIHRPVLDITGLRGNYNLTLGPFTERVDPNSSGPSIFTVIQEQLGLHLEEAKVPVQVFVIDRVEKPR
jgi:uncharacterized protein (TIGR03435 family)